MLGPVPYFALGCVALFAVWVAALLCAAASVNTARALGRRARALAGLREGTVAQGDGPGGALAEHRVLQLARALDAEPPALAFSDKGYRGEVFGGEVQLDGVATRLPAQADLEVWPDGAKQASAALLASDSEFDALYKDARSKGSPRDVVTRLLPGDRVYFVTSGEGEGATLTFLSATPPAPFLARRRAAHLLFAAGELAVCAALTAVALWPPLFGAISTAGGVGLLAFFLIVQPLGVAVEEASREPSRAFLRGTQRRSAPFPGGVVPGRTTTQVSNG
ncbi:MAG TPA: hypothetical protein PLR99_13755 [Polyangiaceae bacterium]|nr:hypothetical protein [Polyangiaceae bacterium]